MFEIIRRIWQTGVVTQEPLALAAPPRYRGKLIIDQTDCSGCSRCESICPAGAIRLQPESDSHKTGGQRIEVSYGKCVFCGLCAEACPDGIIEQSRIIAWPPGKKANCCSMAGEGGLKVSELSEQEQLQGEELRRRIRALLGPSLHIRHVDSGSCNGCDFEMSTLTNPVYDVQRFGIDFVASPRHADMLMVTGGVTRHLEEAVQKTYNAAAEPETGAGSGDLRLWRRDCRSVLRKSRRRGPTVASDGLYPRLSAAAPGR